MSKRIERTGIDLEMTIIRSCAQLLMKLPVEARMGAVDWLAKRVAAQGGDKAPQVPDPRQADMFPDG